MSDSSSRLPARPSLEQLQKQAKELLKQCRAGEKTALDRFLVVNMRSTDSQPTLADAQFVLAREYGFESWARLRDQVSIMRSTRPLFLSSTVPFYTVDWLNSEVSVQGPQSEKNWDAVLGVMTERRINKLRANSMSDSVLERLADLNHVTHLRIAGSSGVTDQGVKHLVRMPQLQDLELGGQNSTISDQRLDSLRQLTNLRRFQACWTPGISDAGLVGLSHCDQLEDVNVLGTQTGDGTIRALMGKRHLRYFRSGQRVTDAGLALFQNFPVFRTWQGGDIGYGLMSADTKPNHLLIDGPFTDAGLASLRGLEGLFALSFFWHCPAFTSEGLRPLQQLLNLGFLGCQSNHCDDDAMRHIADFPRLRMLMGQSAVASDAGFEALSHSQTIEYIWGRECPNLTGRGFAALASMPALRGIAVSCKKVGDASLARLIEFPALREFMPIDVPDAGFRHIGRCQNLEALWCMYCRDTGDVATEHIAGLSQLKTYYAGKTDITDRSLETLGHMVSLEHIELWQCAGLTDTGLAYLAGLPKLREIRLHGLSNVTRKATAMFPLQVQIKYSE